MIDVAIRKHIGKLSQRYNGISSVFLFGSFINSAKFSDVDIVIVFDRIEDTTQARHISWEFSEVFATPLHIQIFFKDQKSTIDHFLLAARPWEKVHG